MTDTTEQLFAGKPPVYREIVLQECNRVFRDPELVVGKRARTTRINIGPRRRIAYRLWAERRWSFVRIGQAMGMDHTTVIYHVRRELALRLHRSPEPPHVLAYRQHYGIPYREEIDYDFAA